MLIYLIRHGKTIGNEAHRYIGTTDEPLLASEKELLFQLRKLLPLRPGKVFCSKLMRTGQTAEGIYPDITPQSISGLNECDFGDFEQKNYAELQGDPRYDELLRAMTESPERIAFPNGETFQDFSSRSIQAFFCCLAECKDDSSAVFFAHGGTIMSIMSQLFAGDYYDYQVENLGGYLLQWDETAFEFEADALCEKASDFEDDAENGCITQKYLRNKHFTYVKKLERSRLLQLSENEDYVLVNHKRLRCGYTTGTCAAAAAKAATWMLLRNQPIYDVKLMTPNGKIFYLSVEAIEQSRERISCAIRKDGGDDIDATDGMLIHAEVMKNDSGKILIDGGIGIGRVTKPGLNQPVGAAAINSVPRKMIYNAVSDICDQFGYQGGISVNIYAPEGEEIAKKTFNSNLGIVGGISILGTSGIVMPMSQEALLESIRMEMRMLVNGGASYLLITPGNYGEDFVRNFPELANFESMKCSNYVGSVISMAEELDVKGILFVSHIGKFIKVSGGIMNTHSAEADCRMELLAASALRCGADAELCRSILNEVSTDGGLALIRNASDSLYASVCDDLCMHVAYHLKRKAGEGLKIGCILFSGKEMLGKSEEVPDLIEALQLQHR